MTTLVHDGSGVAWAAPVKRADRWKLYPAGVRKCKRAACKVVKKFRSGTAYCSQSCGSLDTRLVASMKVSPADSRRRALAAAKVAVAARKQKAYKRVEGFHPVDAYKAGYGSGFTAGRKNGYSAGYRDAIREMKRKENAA